MAQGKRLATFVVRYWWLPHDERRLDIEHVQSGERHRCASLSEAEAWFVERVRATSVGGAAASAPRGGGARDEGQPG